MSRLMINKEHDEAIGRVLQDVLSISESEEAKQPHDGSKTGRASNVDRQRSQGHMQLHRDYLRPCPVRTHSFDDVFVCLDDSSTQYTKNLSKNTGTSSRERTLQVARALMLTNIRAALRLSAYVCAADSVDEYGQMSELTASECLKHISRSVVQAFGDEYLRTSTLADPQKALKRVKGLGFPAMVGSIDCSKWIWKNCPVAWRGQHQGKDDKPGLTLEAIADDKLWIWRALFGTPRSANDINVLDVSPLVNKVAKGSFSPTVSFTLNGNDHDIPYILL